MNKAPIRLALRRLAARLTPAFGYGRCYHCNLPWNIVQYHDLPYARDRSLFFTCTWCWPKTTTHQRIGYLDHLIWGVWARSKPAEDLDRIYTTVLTRHILTPTRIEITG